MELLNVKACVFDTFGTVLDWRASVSRQVAEVAETKGVEGDWNDFTDQWRGYYYTWTAEIGQGKRQYLSIDYIHRIGLDHLAEEFGLPLSDEEKTSLLQAWRHLDPWPDSVEGLTRLKKKFIISPLSNSDFGMMTEMSKNAGLPWDAIVAGSDGTMAADVRPLVRMNVNVIVEDNGRREQASSGGGAGHGLSRYESLNLAP